MTEKIVTFFLTAVWLVAMAGAAIYAIAVFISIISIVDGFGVFLCSIVFFVFVCAIINIFKSM